MPGKPALIQGAAGHAAISRRQVLGRIAFGAGASWASPSALAIGSTTPARSAAVRWITTTRERPWREAAGATRSPASFREPWHVEVLLDRRLQAIEGFGACFNELGWVALRALSAADRDAVLRELFAPGVGACFRTCRMPVGANDFARDWYSYDETPASSRRTASWASTSRW